MIEPDQPLAPIHPEEMTASVDLRIGSASLQAKARATPAGFVGIALLLLSAAALVWAVRRGTPAG